MNTYKCALNLVLLGSLVLGTEAEAQKIIRSQSPAALVHLLPEGAHERLMPDVQYANEAPVQLPVELEKFPSNRESEKDLKMKP